MWENPFAEVDDHDDDDDDDLYGLCVHASVVHRL